MINYLKGRIRRLYREESRLIVDVNGIGYELLLPYFVMRSIEDDGVLEGDVIELEVFFHASERQPKPILVGFREEFERSFFEKLIQVEDVGVNTAAKALVFSVSTIARAIEDGDVGVLVRMPGIGKRTAEKMIATLRGKLAEWTLLLDKGYNALPDTRINRGIEEEVLSVLINLGHRIPDAKEKISAALEAAPDPKDTQELLREIFRLNRDMSN